MDSSHIWHKWPLAWEGVSRAMTFDSRSFSHDFAIKLLKYGTSCSVHSTACTVLDQFFSYLAQMITSMRSCVAWNDIWPWHISSRLFSCDVAYFMDYIRMWHKYNPGGKDVSCTISRSTGQRSRSQMLFASLQSGQGVSQWIAGLQFLVSPWRNRPIDHFPTTTTTTKQNKQKYNEPRALILRCTVNTTQ